MDVARRTGLSLAAILSFTVLISHSSAQQSPPAASATASSNDTSSSWWTKLVSLHPTLEALVALFAVVGAVSTAWLAVTKFGVLVWNWWLEKRKASALKKGQLQGHYDEVTIQNALRHYVWPKCSSHVDPAHRDEPKKATLVTRESLRDKMDALLEPGDGDRHILILADSGTGKTSFLLNYFAYNRNRRASKRKSIQLIHLGSPDCDERIAAIEESAKTILFLDALDEDRKAIDHGHRERIDELMTMCARFSHVVITCRTQFFPKDEEIPKTTGIVRVGPRKAGESPQYEFSKLYLSPLDDSEVREYLYRRFPFWQRKNRRKAIDVSSKIPLLCARPMLLTHIPDVISRDEVVNSVSDLYRIMVDAWLDREAAWTDKDALREFSEKLAFDIYANSKTRGGERISRTEMHSLASSWGTPLPPWSLTGRSLLNRDAEDNFKFAHRSILEYLFAIKFTTSEASFEGQLSDMAELFIKEDLRVHPSAELTGARRPAAADIQLIVSAVTAACDRPSGANLLEIVRATNKAKLAAPEDASGSHIILTTGVWDDGPETVDGLLRSPGYRFEQRRRRGVSHFRLADYVAAIEARYPQALALIAEGHGYPGQPGRISASSATDPASCHLQHMLVARVPLGTVSFRAHDRGFIVTQTEDRSELVGPGAWATL